MLLYRYLAASFTILGNQKSVTTSPGNDCSRGCDGIFWKKSYPYLVQCREDVVWKLKLRYGTVALFTTKTCAIAVSFDARHTEAKVAKFFNTKGSSTILINSASFQALPLAGCRRNVQHHQRDNLRESHRDQETRNRGGAGREMEGVRGGAAGGAEQPLWR